MPTTQSLFEGDRAQLMALLRCAVRPAFDDEKGDAAQDKRPADDGRRAEERRLDPGTQQQAEDGAAEMPQRSPARNAHAWIAGKARACPNRSRP